MCLTNRKTASAFTLVEVMIAVGLESLVALALVAFFMFAGRSEVALKNYSAMDEQGQLALDQFTKQVRQVTKVVSYTTTTNGAINSLTFNDNDGQTLVFQYDSGAKNLYRIKAGVTNVFLSGCKSLQFQIFQRTPQPYTFDAVTTAVATNCKLVEVTWSCTRDIFGGDKANTEDIQSAKVTIRSD